MTLKERAEAQAKKQMFDMAMSNPTDPFADFEVRDNLKWAYEAGFRAAIRLAAEMFDEGGGLTGNGLYLEAAWGDYKDSVGLSRRVCNVVAENIRKLAEGDSHE